MKSYLRRQIEARQKKAEEEFKSELVDAEKTKALIDQ
jgi:hypothetical protein